MLQSDKHAHAQIITLYYNQIDIYMLSLLLNQTDIHVLTLYYYSIDMHMLNKLLYITAHCTYIPYRILFHRPFLTPILLTLALFHRL